MSVPIEGSADSSSLEQKIRERAASVEGKLIVWRRDIHQHPELGDQEQRTSRLAAEHLRRLGLEVRTDVARTGVVGILKGAKPGRTIALRADMDALPIKEPEGLPFVSKAKGRHWGKEVDVMHACGHDAHTAMLMATAEVLAGLKDDLPGTVMFIFQPAEEGSSLYEPSSGQTWGAKLMLQEGVFAQMKPDAVFGLHVMPGRSGEISYRSGAKTASGDTLDITITGKQGHGGMPWNTIDPITTSALVISGLQTVVSRKANLTVSPAVVTIGTIHGGEAGNIVPEMVHMIGTIRTYDSKVRELLQRESHATAEKIAESAGAKAYVSIINIYDTTINDEQLSERMRPVLDRVHRCIKLFVRPGSYVNVSGRPDDAYRFAECIRPPALRTFPSSFRLPLILVSPDRVPIHRAVRAVKEISNRNANRRADVLHRAAGKTVQQDGAITCSDREGRVPVRV